MVVAVGAAVAVVGLLLTTFAGAGGPAGGRSGTATTVQSVGVPAQQSCTDFDRATARFAAKDNKGFINGMSDGAAAAQAAAAADSRWQTLVGDYAAFATDLAANNATLVYSDLQTLNQDCAPARGQRPLTLNTEPAQG